MFCQQPPDLFQIAGAQAVVTVQHQNHRRLRPAYPGVPRRRDAPVGLPHHNKRHRERRFSLHVRQQTQRFRIGRAVVHYNDPFRQQGLPSQGADRLQEHLSLIVAGHNGLHILGHRPVLHHCIPALLSFRLYHTGCRAKSRRDDFYAAGFPPVRSFFHFIVLIASIRKEEIVTVTSEKAMRVTGI